MLTKIVNGLEVVCSVEEEAEIRAEWAIPKQVQIPSLTPRQVRHALTRAGLRLAVEAAVAAGDQDLKDWWEFATAFERTHPIVISMGLLLGQTDKQMDDLFNLGATL